MTVASWPGSIAAAAASRSIGACESNSAYSKSAAPRSDRRADAGWAGGADLGEPIQEAASSTMALGLAVADQVLDLFGRRRVVDRDRRCAAEVRRRCRARGTRARCASSARRGRRGRPPARADRPRHGRRDLRTRTNRASTTVRPLSSAARSRRRSVARRRRRPRQRSGPQPSSAISSVAGSLTRLPLRRNFPPTVLAPRGRLVVGSIRGRGWRDGVRPAGDRSRAAHAHRRGARCVVGLPSGGTAGRGLRRIERARHARSRGTSSRSSSAARCPSARRATSSGGGARCRLARHDPGRDTGATFVVVDGGALASGPGGSFRCSRGRHRGRYRGHESRADGRGRYGPPRVRQAVGRPGCRALCQ